MNIYKYLPPDRVDILEKLKIRFTQPAALNDPFESFPGTFVPKPKEWYKNEFEKRITNELEKYPSLRGADRRRFIRKARKAFPQYFHDCTDPKTIEELAYEVQKMSSTVSGVLSLSRNHDNILMWSHYASSHKGFVIEFDHEHKFFFNKVHPIIYSDERPEMDLTQVKQSGDLFLTKSKDWAYEEELRMFEPLIPPVKLENGNEFYAYTDSDSKKELDLSVKLFDLPKESVKSIVFGWKIEDTCRKNIIKIIREKEMTWVRLFSASPDNRCFKMLITRYRET